MTRITKRLIIIGGGVASSLVCVVALAVGLYLYVTQPVENGAQLGSGMVTAVVTGRFGPVAIAAYVFELSDGTVGLVDSGKDSDASEIRKALHRLGKRDSDL